jgi:hypothetical protein
VITHYYSPRLQSCAQIHFFFIILFRNRSLMGKIALAPWGLEAK